MNKLLLALLLALTPTAFASVWYVDGVHGSDNNDCKTRQTACRTIGHAISLVSSGDTIGVGSATYTENLMIGVNLKLIGSGAKTTIINGFDTNNPVVTISATTTAAHVTLSGVTIQHGNPGVWNQRFGSLMVIRSAVIENSASSFSNSFGGGIRNYGILTISQSTVANNFATCGACVLVWGGGISNGGTVTINNSTISGNAVSMNCNNTQFACQAEGGGIQNQGTLTIRNSTISGNAVSMAHCISRCFVGGGGISNLDATISMQNSIVANNSMGNCSGFMTSNGYNLSSDGSCTFNGPGDLNNIDPKLGALGNYGGPTQTIPLLAGSPAIDAGNPNGCTDGRGNLLKTDQRGAPRPDKEDTSGCDMGAFERQSD
jgi:hypothetical protein